MRKFQKRNPYNLNKKLRNHARRDYNSSKLLVLVISKHVFINDEEHVMTVFKDITFGVLYEQIKAKE